jgi:hypothetical protein
MKCTFTLVLIKKRVLLAILQNRREYKKLILRDFQLLFLNSSVFASNGIDGFAERILPFSLPASERRRAEMLAGTPREQS